MIFYVYRKISKILSLLFFKNKFSIPFDNLKEVKVKKKIWFHAASAGELEILIPLIDYYSKLNNHFVFVTVWSSSGLFMLQKISKRLNVSVSLSPREGCWRENLVIISPYLFVTVKYEAWPELWGSLNELNIPLMIINAQRRSSLLFCKWFLRFLLKKRPRLFFSVSHKQLEKPLKKTFPEAVIVHSGDPRWDRIEERSQATPLDLFSHLGLSKEKIIVFGSIWPHDLDIWKRQILEIKERIFFVPHSLNQQNLMKIKQKLQDFKLKAILLSESSEEQKEKSSAIIIDQQGMLLELYQFAKWVYVGGGFHQGVHSTMEPAYFGAPVCCGPKNTERFPEIKDLQSTEQLAVLQTEKDVEKWCARIGSLFDSKKDLWKTQTNKQLGATKRLIDWIGSCQF